MTSGGIALLLTSLLPLLGTNPVPSPPPPGRALVPRGRWHHEVAGPPRVSWSVLFRRTDEEDETRLLVQTPSGRFALLSRQPADRLETREEVASLALGESVSRLLAHRVPSGVAECARVAPPDACVVLEGSRGRLASPLSAFSGEGGAGPRRRAAEIVSPAFLQQLKGLVPALPISDLAFYSEDFLALLDPALTRPRGPNLTGPRLPGCAFDASFGFPCTADERRREEWLSRHAPTPPPR